MATYKEIYNIIDNNNLLDAISMIRGVLQQSRRPDELDKLNQIDSTYRYLLKYLRDGHNDPSRNKVISEIKEDLFDLICRLRDDELEKSSSTAYFTGRRLVNFSSLNFAEALGRLLSADATLELSDKSSADYKNALKAKSMALKDLFTIVWTLPVGAYKKLKEVVAVATDSDISFSLRGSIVGALILALDREYDRARLKALLSIAAQSSDDRIVSRALIGIALALDFYPDRIQKDVRLREQFDALTDDLTFYTRMREVVYALVKARGGMKFLGKMKSEIIPDIQKLGPNFLNSLKDDNGEINIDRLEDNPEWDKMLKSSGMEKKLRRLNNMQSSGADMMLSMFEQAKRNVLFNDIDIWFRPFEAWEAERIGMPEELGSLLDTFCANPGICDTDKFAMVANLSRIPASARNMLKQGFEAQASQLAEDMKDMMLHTQSIDFDTECYNFARNLFRFFTFYRLKSEFNNPFGDQIKFFKWPFVGNILSEKEILASVGEFYFKQGFYEDAVNIYKSLIDENLHDLNDKDDRWKAFCYQKVGSSFEHLKNYERALKYYNDAFSILPNDEWIATKIVGAADKLSVEKNDKTVVSDASKALAFLYQKDKNNLNWLIPLAELGLFSPEMLAELNVGKIFERMDYIAPDDPRVIRLMAKKKLTGHSAEEAVKLLAPLVDNVEMYLASASLESKISVADGSTDSVRNPDEQKEMLCDVILMAFAAFMKGDLQKMISCLRLVLSLSDDDNAVETISKILKYEIFIIELKDVLSAFIQLLPVSVDAIKAESASV